MWLLLQPLFGANNERHYDCPKVQKQARTATIIIPKLSFLLGPPQSSFPTCLSSSDRHNHHPRTLISSLPKSLLVVLRKFLEKPVSPHLP
ncbi:hypothetical protein PoB_002476200 [Plakobranchus ocellatus]|uniref:Uncharacterized protein n=1 Tax=Plakobranchus ocellatus TaxID=259542 RepID=A0AAV3ZUM5_9GAST|nr:hypothetical protein PoB_002476200 [Plakobranchus ocellatus]